MRMPDETPSRRVVQTWQRQRARSLVLAGLIVIVAPACQDSDAALPPDQGVVVHLVDGDTLDIEIQGTRERVRVLGVDTPETKKKDTPIECFGPEASAFTAAAFPTGTTVSLQRDQEARDHYGRLLAVVSRVSDGFDLGYELVRQGYATALIIKPNTALSERYRDAEADARSEGAGLWSACPSG
jgi:micrococcal nuclease